MVVRLPLLRSIISLYAATVLFRNDNSPPLDDDALKNITPLSKTIPLSCFLLIDSYVVSIASLSVFSSITPF